MSLLRQEVAYLALHVHWSYEVIMNMEHQERREWVEEISRLIGPVEAKPPTKRWNGKTWVMA